MNIGKRYTSEEFLNKVTENNEYIRKGTIEIRGNFSGWKNKIDCFCTVHNVLWSPKAEDLCKGIGCKRCGSEKAAAKILVPREEIVMALDSMGHGIRLIGESYGVRAKAEFQCSFGHIWTTRPISVLRGYGCPYCSGKKVWIGFNDLWTVRPDVAKLLKNQEDGFKYTCGSHQKLDFVCKDCGSIINKPVKEVCKRGLSCHFCSDGVSYPNKFGRAILRQLPLETYKSEYNPDWLKPYYYDNYFEYDGKKYVLEMDGGLGHGHKKFRSEQSDVSGLERDVFKDSLAVKNDIIVIRIDCLQSNKDYIKNNILSSMLSDVFDLSCIDWNLCDLTAQHSILKDACSLYNSGVNSVTTISDILNISQSAVYSYLKRGTKLGLCAYNPSHSPTPIDLVDANEHTILSFRSYRECAIKIRDMYGIIINDRKLKDFCESKQPYKGFNFRFANLTIQN